MSFDASEAFAFSKPAGVPCRNLKATRCAVHAQLRERGLAGCAAFDCYGAGQRVTRTVSEDRQQAAFFVLREVHELLWLLTEAAKLCPPRLAELLLAQAAELDALGPDADLVPHRSATRALFERVRRECRPTLRGSPSHLEQRCTSS
jgi:hypothetical protein